MILRRNLHKQEIWKRQLSKLSRSLLINISLIFLIFTDFHHSPYSTQITFSDIPLWGVKPINKALYWYGILKLWSSWIHTSRGWGRGGGRLATFAALSLSTSRACLRAFIRLVNKRGGREREREEEKQLNSSSNNDSTV